MLNFLTITEAHRGLIAKKFTVFELVQSCLDRIKVTDSYVNSFLTVRSLEELMPEIKHAQKRIDSGDYTRITGIPYSAKDLFCTEGIRTTASSKILEDFYPTYESTVTQRLKEAGAIMIGKTNLDEFAHGSSTETSAYKISRTPWDTKRNAGGSSGGSGSSVAAHQCIFSVGTSTAGSIQNPSSMCGITGLKGTYGRVSRYGVIAMGSSLDSPGPMCKTVEDTAIVLEIIAGYDKKDSTTSTRKIESYSNLNRDTLRGLRIGVPKSYIATEMQNGVKRNTLNAIEKLEELGAKIVEIDLLKPDYATAVYTILCRSEVSSNLSRYDGIRYGNQPNSENSTTIYEYIKKARSENGFGLEAKRRIMTGTFALSVGYSKKYYEQAQKVRTLIIEDFKKAFKKVDIMLSPTTPNTADLIGGALANPLYGELADIFACGIAVAGLPAITVPSGFVNGLPTGLQLFGPHFSEKLCLEVAKVYQDNTEWHRKIPQLGVNSAKRGIDKGQKFRSSGSLPNGKSLNSNPAGGDK